MGVSCRILLTNTKDIYRAGDSVEGIVKYVIDKPTEFTSIILYLKSKELFYWEPITPRTIKNKTEEFDDKRIDILHAKEGEIVTLQPGSYSKLFIFILPEEIPSSYKDFKCFISFFVQLEFIKPNPISVPQVFYIEIEVQSGVKPRRDVRYRQSKVEKEFNVLFSKKTVTLMADILTPVYLGKDLPVFLSINNPAEIPLVSIKAELIEYVRYKSHENQMSSVRFQQTSEPLQGLEITFLGINRLKTKLSYNPHFYIPPDKSSIDSKILRKEYEIQVTLKFLFPHRELCLVAPVVIAGEMAPSFWQDMKEKGTKNYRRETKMMISEEIL